MLNCCPSLIIEVCHFGSSLRIFEYIRGQEYHEVYLFPLFFARFEEVPDKRDVREERHSVFEHLLCLPYQSTDDYSVSVGYQYVCLNFALWM